MREYLEKNLEYIKCKSVCFESSTPCTCGAEELINNIKQQLKKFENIPRYTESQKEDLLRMALTSEKGKLALGQAMANPIRRSLPYQGIGRKAAMEEQNILKQSLEYIKCQNFCFDSSTPGICICGAEKLVNNINERLENTSQKTDKQPKLPDGLYYGQIVGSFGCGILQDSSNLIFDNEPNFKRK